MMRSYLTAVLTMTCLLGFGMSARAQENVRVTVPFEFVAGGATLPAGQYSVSRFDPSMSRGLMFRSYNKPGAFALPLVFSGDENLGGEAKLSFQHVGDKYFLNKVATGKGVYSFQTPNAVVSIGQVKDQGASSSSGAN